MRSRSRALPLESEGRPLNGPDRFSIRKERHRCDPPVDGQRLVAFRDRVQVIGIKEVVAAPRSPWQNSYVERFIGSIRRECLDHIIIFNERHLRDVLLSHFQYHHKSRTHLSLGKDYPQPRPIQPPSAGIIIVFLPLGGLHNRDERRAA
jgi:transposase InsO family protein